MKQVVKKILYIIFVGHAHVRDFGSKDLIISPKKNTMERIKLMLVDSTCESYYNYF